MMNVFGGEGVSLAIIKTSFFLIKFVDTKKMILSVKPNNFVPPEMNFMKRNDMFNFQISVSLRVCVSNKPRILFPISTVNNKNVERY